MGKNIYYIELTNTRNDDYTYEHYCIADSEDSIEDYFDSYEHVTRIELEYENTSEDLLEDYRKRLDVTEIN